MHTSWIAFLGFLGWTVFGGVPPVAEEEQAKLAMSIIDQFHGPRGESAPKKLHVVYFTPAEREPAARYEERLERILEDIQGFYRDGMERLGFGQKSFILPRDGDGKLVIHLVKSRHPAEAFPGWEERNGGNTGSPEGGEMVKRECEPVLKEAGISMGKETVMIFCHLANWNEKERTFRPRSPYFGMWNQESGLCFAADWANQDLEHLTKKKPMLRDAEYGRLSLGKHTTIFIGGIAHELGHAFALPHCGERWDEKRLGTSLMGGGNHTYREELRGEGVGSFLTMGSAMRLASRPLFNHSDKEMEGAPELEESELSLSTNLMRAELAGRRGGLRLEGRVRGTPRIYGVVAYFDSGRDGGYRAPTATAVPDREGKFAIEVSDLAACANGLVRVEFCHVNGAVSERQIGFSVTESGEVDLTQWALRESLKGTAEAVAREDREAAEAALKKLENSDGSVLAKEIARKLTETLKEEPRKRPSEVGADVREFALGDAQATSAEVGWLSPMANRVPLNRPISSPLLDSGELYGTGLYGHAPSRYVYELGGKWKELSGQGGLHTLQQPYGSVVFVVKADGREVYRSGLIRGDEKASYKIDVRQVRELELIVENGGDGNGNDWGLWLAPVLSR